MPSTIQTTSATVIEQLDLNPLFNETPNEVPLCGPTRLGYFSCSDYENKSVYSQDESALRYLDLPDPVNINCLQGYDPNVKYGYFIPKDTLLLEWILNNETTMQKFPSDFICYNSVMKNMMAVKYYDFNWNLSAIKIRGKIVLNNNESIEKKESIDLQPENVKKSSYSASNLPNLVSKRKDHSECTPGYEECSFYGVFHSKIGSHQILHAAWLHCVESKQELDKPFEEMKFVLIKKFDSPRESHSLFQSSTWWSLAKLAGVDTVVRAKCDQGFTVKTKPDKLKVGSLINKRIQTTFVASLNMILDFIKTIVKEENKCYSFYFNGKNKKLTVEGKTKPDGEIIPSWYIDGQLPNKSQ